MLSINNKRNTTYRRLAVMLIVVGLLFAVDSILNLSFVYKLWPILLTVMGSGLVAVYFKRKTQGTFILAAGEYLICFSLLALYCNFTDWGQMGNLWPLFIVFLAINFTTFFIIDTRRRLMLLAGLLLFSLAISFFVIFSAGGQFWWVILILTGTSIYISGGRE
ncbi:MAG: hypothetical protein ACYTFY_20195 [Planctomycetota bacterium]|jgi:hypothetical protein